MHWWCLGYSDCKIKGKYGSLRKIDPSLFRAFIAIVPGMAILLSASKTIKTEKYLFKPQIFYESPKKVMIDDTSITPIVSLVQYGYLCKIPLMCCRASTAIVPKALCSCNFKVAKDIITDRPGQGCKGSCRHMESILSSLNYMTSHHGSIL